MDSLALQVGIITQDRYDTFSQLRGTESGKSEKDQSSTELSAKARARRASEMKPSWDDPIKSLVLTGDDVEQLSSNDWDTIASEYMEIVFARTTPDQKLRIVEETKKRGDNIVAVVSAYY